MTDQIIQLICFSSFPVGTHDLDTITGPFIYDAQPPKDISFVPLNQTEVFRSDILLEKYSHDLHLREFVPIIKVEWHPKGSVHVLCPLQHHIYT